MEGGRMKTLGAHLHQSLFHSVSICQHLFLKSILFTGYSAQPQGYSGGIRQTKFQFTRVYVLEGRQAAARKAVPCERVLTAHAWHFAHLGFHLSQSLCPGALGR